MKPTTFRSSSAAYRSIRQYEAKNGKTQTTVEKLGDKVYLRLYKKTDLTFQQLSETTPNVVSNGIHYKHFPDGVNGDGYYELKTGNRRRPNSEFVNIVDVYIGINEGTFRIK